MRYTADELGFHPITELIIDIPDVVVVEKKKPDLENKYLPPTNTYLPPRNTYLPPAGKAPPTNRNDIPRDLQLPRFWATATLHNLYLISF